MTWPNNEKPQELDPSRLRQLDTIADYLEANDEKLDTETKKIYASDAASAV